MRPVDRQPGKRGEALRIHADLARMGDRQKARNQFYVGLEVVEDVEILHRPAWRAIDIGRDDSETDRWQPHDIKQMTELPGQHIWTTDLIAECGHFEHESELVVTFVENVLPVFVRS